MLCEDQDTAKTNLGAAVSTQLINRLADIVAAGTVYEMPPAGNPVEITIGSFPAYQVDLHDQYILVFVPNHVKTPYLKDNQVDWNKINRIKVIAIQQN